MPWLSIVFGWVRENEQVLSGIAAGVFLLSLVAAPLTAGLRSLLLSRKRALALAATVPAGVASADPPSTPTLDELLSAPAVAVLPFANPGGDSEQEYFADGITEDLITSLSYYRLFPVIARNSVFAFKGRHADAGSIARQLSARYLIEGSVRRQGTQLRVTARLTDAAAGHEIWSERFDRELRDVFALQDELAQRICKSIEPQLSRAEERRALRKRPENLDTWDCSLRALWHIRRGTREDYREAQRMLASALQQDAGSSYAHSMLALCRFHDALLGWTEDPPRALAGTLAAAREAVALDDGDWLAHALLGIAWLWTDRRYDEAIAAEERALALNPSASTSYQFLGCVLVFAGRHPEAIASLEAVLQLDPLYQSRSMVLADLSLAHLLLHHAEQAASLAQRAVEEQPTNVRAHQRLVASLGYLGRREAASSALAELRRRQPDLSLAYLDATYPFRDPDDRALFLDGLRRAGFAVDAAHAPSGEGI